MFVGICLWESSMRGICLWESAAAKVRVESYIESTDNTDNYTLCMFVGNCYSEAK